MSMQAITPDPLVSSPLHAISLMLTSWMPWSHALAPPFLQEPFSLRLSGPEEGCSCWTSSGMSLVYEAMPHIYCSTWTQCAKKKSHEFTLKLLQGRHFLNF